MDQQPPVPRVLIDTSPLIVPNFFIKIHEWFPVKMLKTSQSHMLKKAKTKVNEQEIRIFIIIYIFFRYFKWFLRKCDIIPYSPYWLSHFSRSFDFLWDCPVIEDVMGPK